MLAPAACALLDAELCRFCGVVEAAEPRAAVLACATLQSLFCADLDAALAAASPQPPPLEAVLGVLRAAEAVVAHVASCAIAAPQGDPPAPVDVALRAAPLLDAWVARRLAQLATWAQRDAQAETWGGRGGAGLAGGPAHPAPSAVNLARAAREALSAFFRLRVLQAPAARDLVAGLGERLATYGAQAARALGPPGDLLPPPPPLTRFKREALELLRAEKAERERGGAGPPRAAPAPPARCGLEAALCVHASVSLLAGEAAALEAEAKMEWEALARSPGTLRRGAADPQPWAGLLAHAGDALQRVRPLALGRCAEVVVFHHLWGPFLEGAYSLGCTRPEARLPTALLEPLNAWMALLCDAVAEADRDDVALAVLRSVAAGVARVLLDGGPQRAFTQDDVDRVAEDVAAVRDFFEASGDGLHPSVVQAALLPVVRIVDWMRLDSHQLIAAHEAAQAGGARDVLYHILAHRADRTCSKCAAAGQEPSLPRSPTKRQVSQSARAHAQSDRLRFRETAAVWADCARRRARLGAARVKLGGVLRMNRTRFVRGWLRAWVEFTASRNAVCAFTRSDRGPPRLWSIARRLSARVRACGTSASAIPAPATAPAPAHLQPQRRLVAATAMPQLRKPPRTLRRCIFGSCAAAMRSARSASRALPVVIAARCASSSVSFTSAMHARSNAAGSAAGSWRSMAEIWRSSPWSAGSVPAATPAAYVCSRRTRWASMRAAPWTLIRCCVSWEPLAEASERVATVSTATRSASPDSSVYAAGANASDGTSPISRSSGATRVRIAE